MSFQSQPNISSFFRQLTPQEREARSAAANQKAREEGFAKRPLVAPILAALAPAPACNIKIKKMEIGLDL
jgi:hypothetical protein